MSKIKLLSVGLVRESFDDAPPKALSVSPVLGPDDAARILRAVLPQDREGFAVLMLDARGRCVAVNVVSIGSLNTTIVHPREVFKAAILANACAIIIGHNHPSGDTKPSQEDLTITRRLELAGETLGVPLRDHVIISDTSTLSFKTRGLI